MPGMRVKIADLPEKYRRQAEAQLIAMPMTPMPLPKPLPNGYAALSKIITGKPQHVDPRPNQTEGAFRRLYIHTQATHVRYEAITLRLSNGHRYTPDWTWRDHDGAWCAAEVKGTYRHASHGRSQLAFAQARIDFPEYQWYWAVMQSDGSFKVTTY